jgi:hypothetical protein
MSDHESRAPAVSELAKAILREFAESFPESAHYRGGRRLRKGGWEAIFPAVAQDVEAKEAFLESVDELCSLGVIEVKWKRFRPGTEVEALYLQDPHLLFSLLGRQTPDEMREKMLGVLHSHAWASISDAPGAVDFVESIRVYLEALLEARHPVPVRSADELLDLGHLFHISTDDAASLPIRALSIRSFGESKRLEQLLRVADQISQKVVGEAFSSNRGLLRSYPEVALALVGTITLRGGLLQTRGEILSLPAETVHTIEHVALTATDVLSIENKESFYVLARHLRRGNLPEGFGAIVYSGGYPHDAYGVLLRQLAKAGASLHHFGDLDADGILILQEIERTARQPVAPFGMSASLYRRFVEHGIELSDGRLDRLRAALDTLPAAAHELAHLILQHRRGVEQEVIGLEDLF